MAISRPASRTKTLRMRRSSRAGRPLRATHPIPRTSLPQEPPRIRRKQRLGAARRSRAGVFSPSGRPAWIREPGGVGGGVAGEQLERVVGRAGGLGDVDEQVLALVGRRERLVGEVEVADHGVVESLGAGGVDADVVGGPAGPELLAAGGELADEVGQVAVVGVAAGFGAQDGDGVVGGLVPVAQELRGARGRGRCSGRCWAARRPSRRTGRTGPCRARCRPGG